MMSYSYTAPGASGDHYHIMSQDVARTLYFAGEVVLFIYNGILKGLPELGTQYI